MGVRPSELSVTGFQRSSLGRASLQSTSEGYAEAYPVHPFGVARTDENQAAKAKWSTIRLRLADVVESRRWELTMALLIVINAVLVVYETDRRAESETAEVPLWLSRSMKWMLILYMIELAIRLTVYRRLFFDNSWNVFDLGVISVDVFSEMLSIFNVSVGFSVSVLRILRLGRLLRFVQVLSIFHELYMMLHLMMSAFRAICWGVALMVVMLTIWSIIAVEMLHPLNRAIAETGVYEGCDRCPRAFESVFQSNLTFFQQIIAGDSWGQVSVVLIENYPATAFLLISVVVSLNLGLMNLVITVIVDKAQTSRDENIQMILAEKERDFVQAKKKLVQLCESVDQDNSGEITETELHRGFEIPEFSDTMKVMDITPNDLHTLFSIMDEDGSGKVSYDEFAEQLHRMKTQDTQTTIIFIKAYVNEIRDILCRQMHLLKDEIHERLVSVEKHVVETSSGRGQQSKIEDDVDTPVVVAFKQLRDLMERHLASDTRKTMLLESLLFSKQAEPPVVHQLPRPATPSSTWRTSQEKTKITGVQHYFTLERTNETHEAADMGRSPTPQAQHYQRGGTAAGSDSAHGSGSLWTPGHWAVDDSRCLPPRPLRAGTC